MLESWSTLGGFILLLCFSSVCSDGFSGRQHPSHGSHDSSISTRQISGLYPFPRVGRSGGETFEEDEWEPMINGFNKRKSLIPFPRIGKRHRGLFTFPRVGKSVDDFAMEPRYTPRPILGSFLQPEDITLEEAIMSREDVPLRTLFKRSIPQSGLWFGSRQARKKRSTMEDEADLNLHPLGSFREREQTWPNSDGEELGER